LSKGLKNFSPLLALSGQMNCPCEVKKNVTVHGYFLLLYLHCASGIIRVMVKLLERIRFLEKENTALTKLVAELRNMFAMKENILQ
jgi:hypothetical protein